MNWDLELLDSKFLGDIEQDIGNLCDISHIFYDDLRTIKIAKHSKGWVILTYCEEYFGFFEDKEECLKFLIFYYINQSDKTYDKVMEAVEILNNI